MKLLTTKTIKLTALATGMLATTTVAHAGVTWDMPMAYPASNYHTQNAERFAAAIAKATNGELKIRIHAGGSLFKGNEILRAVQTGQAPIAERLLSAHANDEPLFATDSIPFLATSFKESALLWQALQPVINQKLKAKNLKLLYSTAWPPQGFYTKKAINKIGDFQGLRMRGYNTITSDVAVALKAEPLQIEAAELTQALATGVADSFISSGSTGNDIKAWEVLTHYNDFRAWLPRNYVFVNLKEWNKLPKSTRNIVEAIADVTQYAALTEAEKLTDWYMEQFRKNGMKVVKAPDALRNAMKDRTKHMLQKYLDKGGADAQKVIDNYNKLKAEAGLK